MTHPKPPWTVMALLLCAASGACSDDESSPPSSVTLQGATACERYASLAAAKGCAAPTTCTVAAQCDAQAIAWLDCAATDLAQCSCEADGALNCEGSYKPGEGPARCIDAFTTFSTCGGM